MWYVRHMVMCFFLMIRLPPRSTRTDPLLPYTTLFRSGLGVFAWISARAKASRLQAGGTARLHSRPNYHGWYVTLWTILPACLFLIIWSNVTPGLVPQAVLENPAASHLSSEERRVGKERGRTCRSWWLAFRLNKKLHKHHQTTTEV